MLLPEIVATLDACIEPKKIFRFFSKHKTFEGELTQDGFKVMRIISHRNSFLPVITGKFIAGQSGSTISIKMRLHAFTSAFLCVWFGGDILGIAIVLIGLASGRVMPTIHLIIPFGMFVFGFVMVVSCFWPEAKKAKGILTEILQKHNGK